VPNPEPASIIAIVRDLCAELAACRFGPPVAFVYRPLEYAAAVHTELIRRFGRGPKRYLLVGMNPGPWGMAQTGVPFGAVSSVRDWMGLGDFEIGRPLLEHCKRPVLGFACPREEVSGQRLWGWARDHFGTAERFFELFWVVNYCPLLFLDEGGRNLTPEKLQKEDRRRILEPCDRALLRLAKVLSTEQIIAVGTWAESRSRIAGEALHIPVARILHPSPASPAANRGWAEVVTEQMRELGVPL